MPALVEALKDKEWTVRQSAAEALGKIGPKAEAAVPALAEALKDKNSVVRRIAAQALAQIGLPAVPALAKALQDKETDIRLLAAVALGQMGLEAKGEGEAALAEARRKDDVDAVRKAAGEALQRIQDAQ